MTRYAMIYIIIKFSLVHTGWRVATIVALPGDYNLSPFSTTIVASVDEPHPCQMVSVPANVGEAIDHHTAVRYDQLKTYCVQKRTVVA